MPLLTLGGQKTLNGPTLSLDNIDIYSAKLAQKDRNLLQPPKRFKNPHLYDIFNVLQKRKTDGKRLFNELIRSYFDADRLTRVSSYSFIITIRASGVFNFCF